jgi:polyribonucleotide nucleotidyltransferase
MKKYFKTEFEVGGKTLTLEINKVAMRADTSVIARYGDTEVLATVIAGKPSNLGYFPLTVDFVERLYAGGIIKGSRWVKREGRPTDDAVLIGRLIDRAIRPLFPKDYQNEVQVMVTLLSTDGENDHDVLSLIAVSAALSVSSIPWNGPVGAVRMGYIAKDDLGLVINPETSQMEFSDLDLVVAGNRDGVVMIEAGGKQLAEEKVKKAMAAAVSETERIAGEIEKIRKEIGREKVAYEPHVIDAQLMAEIDKNHGKQLSDLLLTKDSLSMPNQNAIEDWKEKLLAEYAESQNKNQIGEIVELLLKKYLRKLVLEKNQRIDGRGIEEIRPITCEVGLLPRTHGSAIFQRGLTQVLSVVTLASPSLEQWIETAEGMEEKQYLHHYSDPPYAQGETGRIGALGRREIGHGALAERALQSVIPSQEIFPYTIRVVSEVLSSNGSTSMASTCGSTLALMDAGVPITAPVAGVAMGLVAESSDNYKILTDLSGFEDFYGNMDFKVAGTETGITAIQLDIKLEKEFRGLSLKMIEEILDRARAGRLFILEKMLATLPASRKSVSRYAPKVVTVKIPVEKIGEVIGPGGKTIKNIIATTGADVDVDDDGVVSISSLNEEAVAKAKLWVESLTRELAVGEEFEGEVKRILPFGAFVELTPGKEGLIHISKMSKDFITSPEQVVKIGDKIKVKIYEIDEMGRVNLMMAGMDAQTETPTLPRRNFSANFHRRPPAGGFRPYPPSGGRPSFSTPRPYRGGRRDR